MHGEILVGTLWSLISTLGILQIVKCIEASLDNIWVHVKGFLSQSILLICCLGEYVFRIHFILEVISLSIKFRCI